MRPRPEVFLQSGPAPGPASLDLGLEREAQEGSDQDDQAQESDRLQSERCRNRADDVSANKQLKAQQDPPPQVRAKGLVSLVPVPSPYSHNEEEKRRDPDAAHDDGGTQKFKNHSEGLDKGMCAGQR